MTFEEYKFLCNPSCTNDKAYLITNRDLINQENRTLVLGISPNGTWVHIYLNSYGKNNKSIFKVIYDPTSSTMKSPIIMPIKTNEDYLEFCTVLPEFSDYEFLNIFARRGIPFKTAPFSKDKYEEVKKQDGIFYGKIISFDDLKEYNNEKNRDYSYWDNKTKVRLLNLDKEYECRVCKYVTNFCSPFCPCCGRKMINSDMKHIQINKTSPYL